ncbi:MAG: oligosaccharide flippase family protein [Candidatus Nanohaloarchaea archaeon]
MKSRGIPGRSRIYERFETLATVYGTNIFWMNFYQFLNISTSLLVSVAFARLASQSLYGQYIFVISIVSFLSLVSMPGVRTTIFRSVSQGNESFYVDATKFTVLWSLAGIPLLLAIGLYLYSTRAPVVGGSIILASVFFPFMYSLQNWKNLLKAKEEFQSFVVYETSISVTRAVLIIGLLVIQPQNLLSILLAYFASSAILNIYFFARSLGKVSIDGDKIEWKKESYEYTLLNLTSYTFSKMDRVLIGLFLPFNQLAIYNIAVKITDTGFKFIKSSIEAVLPGFFREEYRFSDFYPVFILLFLVPILLYPLVKYPILFLYSSKYAASVFYAQIYLFAVPFYFMAYVSGQALVKEGLSTEVNKARIASVAVFILSAVALIPSIGILGAVVASLAYYPVQILFCLYYLREHQLV